MISKRGSDDYLRVGLKGTNPLKSKWIEVGKVGKLYPHLLDIENDILGSKRLPVGRSDQVLKSHSGRISINLALDRSVRDLDSNGVNETQIQARMEEMEPVKVGRWTKCKCPTI